MACGFHDVTLVDMLDAAGPPVIVGDLGQLRRQWPVAVVSGMAMRQTELELMWHTCKERFRGVQSGCCPYCGRNIKYDMTRHVSSFHLDLAQLWQCPVSWCTQWKGTPQDCVDHIRKTHYVNDSVKAAIYNGVAHSAQGFLVCWSLTSLCHSNGHIDTMPAREINPLTALTRIRSQFLRTQ